MPRIRYADDQQDMERLIEEFEVKGYEVTSDGQQSTTLKKKTLAPSSLISSYMPSSGGGLLGWRMQSSQYIVTGTPIKFKFKSNKSESCCYGFGPKFELHY